jgi:hypothetical protein
MNDTYDVALLLSDDTDYVSAAQAVQARFDKKVVHVGFNWTNLRRACWASIVVDRNLAWRMSEGWIARLSAQQAGSTPLPREQPVPEASASVQPTPQTPTGVEPIEGTNYPATVLSINDERGRATVEYFGPFGTARGVIDKNNLQAGFTGKIGDVLAVKQEIWVKLLSLHSRQDSDLSMKYVNQQTGEEI